MAHYRAFLIGRDGQFVKAVDIICADDQAARLQARQLVEEFDVELWQKDRRVEKFEGAGSLA